MDKARSSSKMQPNVLPPEKTCFVICPIGEPNSEPRRRSDQVLKFIIEPAASDNGLTCIRSDTMTTPGIITNQIIRQILSAQMVVADLTDHNANVFYELAIRHAFRKPVVQIIQAKQVIPFDVQAGRAVKYDLDLESATEAREQVSSQIRAALGDPLDVESPVTIAARLEELSKSATPENKLLGTISDQLDSLTKTISEMSQLVCRTDDLKELIPPRIQDQMSAILQGYSQEIALLRTVRQAGITSVFKRRQQAVSAFLRFIDEEAQKIMVIGSSLKGLFQKDEYEELKTKLQFKMGLGVQVYFLLTHPIVADFRASQENRRPTEIGLEIIRTLEILKDWKVDTNNVRLYLGTPTCFAIKTTHQMLINPYPYISVSFDSPCLTLEYSPDGGAERPGYFFDEFNSKHFGAWDSNLAVHITDYDETIESCREMLPKYAESVEKLLESGKLFRRH